MAWASKSEFQKQIFDQKQTNRLLGGMTFTHWFHECSWSTCNSLNKYSLSIYSVPSRAVGLRYTVPDRVGNKRKKAFVGFCEPCFCGLKEITHKMTLWRMSWHGEWQAWGREGTEVGSPDWGGQWQSCLPSIICLWKASSELKPDFEEWAVHLDGCRPWVGLEFYSVYKEPPAGLKHALIDAFKDHLNYQGKQRSREGESGSR